MIRYLIRRLSSIYRQTLIMLLIYEDKIILTRITQIYLVI